MKLKYILIGTAVTAQLIGDDDVVAKEFSVDAKSMPKVFGEGDSAKTLAGYGLLKLMQDRTSQVTESKEAKLDAMEAFVKQLGETGQWRSEVERSGGGSRARKVDVYLVKAVADLKGLSETQAASSLRALDKEQYDQIVKSEKVKAKIAEIKAAEGESETADLGDLL